MLNGFDYDSLKLRKGSNSLNNIFDSTKCSRRRRKDGAEGDSHSELLWRIKLSLVETS